MRGFVISVILACAALVVAPAALADGDPASDVLVSLPYFDPINLALPASTSAKLDALLSDSQHAGFPIRVALIASAGNLGTASALWEKPVSYASFLQDELSLLYGGQVLVVMPNGFGLAGPAGGPHAVGRAELSARAPAPGPGVRLADAALSAVPRLAAAAGHPIPSARLSALDHVKGELGRETGKDLPTSALLTILIGMALIALSWRASLRRRPPSLRRRLQS